MKTIKFTPELTELIKKGKKTTTFKLFDDKVTPRSRPRKVKKEE